MPRSNLERFLRRKKSPLTRSLMTRNISRANHHKLEIFKPGEISFQFEHKKQHHSTDMKKINKNFS